MSDLKVYSSPHIHSGDSVKNIMWTVVFSLLPVFIASIYFFGLPAFTITAACIISCVATESFITSRYGTAGNVKDGSAVLTGLLLAFCLPPTVPLWIPVLGGVFAMGVVKHAFGGLGVNVFNPALMGRAFLLASWPVLMTTWRKPFDAVTSATPLAVEKMQGMQTLMESMGGQSQMYKDLLIGNIGGCLGETSALLLAIGGLYLLWKGVITWHTPTAYFATVIVLSFLMGEDVLFHLLAGGLMIGAFYMATDYVTTPITGKGKLVFGLGCGLITMAIRVYGGLPEGVSYSILIMNAFTPLIDRHTMRTPKGWSK